MPCKPLILILLEYASNMILYLHGRTISAGNARNFNNDSKTNYTQIIHACICNLKRMSSTGFQQCNLLKKVILLIIGSYLNFILRKKNLGALASLSIIFSLFP